MRYRKTLLTARTKTEAHEAERAELASIHQGTYLSPGSILLSDLIDRYYLPGREPTNAALLTTKPLAK